MASGKKNYFRHSFFAHNDIKLKRFRDEIGIGFYFYYFSLLECLGTECEYESRDTFEIHFSTLRSLWGGNLKKINNILSKMNAVGLIFCENGDNSFVISIPNFPKYLGKYANKKESNYPNKRKENKIKEKESKVIEKAPPPSPVLHDVIEYLNLKAKKNFKHTTAATTRCINARLNDGYSLDDFKKVIDVKTGEWIDDEKMNQYLRPTTLFGTKFENYLNQKKPMTDDEFLNALDNLRVME